jgi:hypothetical protein
MILAAGTPEASERLIDDEALSGACCTLLPGPSPPNKEPTNSRRKLLCSSQLQSI